MIDAPAPQPVRPTEEGFTLIEVLVVLTIAVMAFALVPGTVRVGQRLMSAAADVEQAASGRRALAVLERRIAAARPLFASSQSGLTRLIFEGTSERLRFVTALADGPQAGGLYIADIHLAGGGGGPQSWLTMTLEPYPAGDDAANARHAYRLLPARGLSMRYASFDPARGENVWRSDWTDTSRLPDAVEVTVPGTAPRLVRLHLNVVGGPPLNPTP